MEEARSTQPAQAAPSRQAEGRHKKLAVCPNCNTPLPNHENFCPTCGQENHEVKLPLGHIAYEFIESITHFDNKLWNTLKAIFTRPGQMTTEFLAGKRARYVPPARLYVFVSVIFFFLLNNFADHQINREIRSVTDASGNVRFTILADARSVINNDSLLRARGLLPLANLPLAFPTQETDMAGAVRRLKRFSDAQLDSLLAKNDVATTLPNRQQLRTVFGLLPDRPTRPYAVGLLPNNGRDVTLRFPNDSARRAFQAVIAPMTDAQLDSVVVAAGGQANWMNRRIVRQGIKFVELFDGGNDLSKLSHIVLKNLSLVMFVLMPFVAVLLLLIYYRRGRYYYEHLIFSVHIHTVIFLLLSLVLLATYPLSADWTSRLLSWTLLGSWLYFLLSLKRVYGQRWPKTIAKFALLSVAYAIVAVLFTAGAVLVGAFTY